MDVRCEKCQTEYELEESRLKPSGVTVKCTQCGHMFRVWGSDGPGARSGSPSSGSSPALSLTPTGNGSQRVWLIRDERGRVQTCRELTTLQQWVVAGRITRDCEISRTGKSWKRLGGINELESFFRIADEAQASAGGGFVLAGAGSAAPAGPLQGGDTKPLPGATQPPARGPRPSSGPLAGGRNPDDVRPGFAPSNGLKGAEATGAWASAPLLTPGSADSGAGPVGGVARVVGDEAAFAMSRRPARLSSEPLRRSTIEPPGPIDDEPIRVPGSGAGRWVVLVSLLLLAGSVGAYFVVVRPTGGAPREPVTIAAPQPPAPQPQLPADSADAEAQDALVAVRQALASDTGVGLAEVAARLATATAVDPALSARLSAARARVMTAQAQHLIDAGAHPEAAVQLATSAAELARAGIGREPGNVDASVALADALRVSGAAAGAVERYLTPVLRGDAFHREALYVRALLRERDGKVADARRIYTELHRGDGDVRPQYRLARLDIAESRRDTAVARLSRVLASHPDHEGARALQQQAAGGTAAASPAEPSPAVTPEPEPAPEPRPSAGPPAAARPSEPDNYAGLVARADKAVERSDIPTARALYERALDKNPAGVDALAGLGYCHVNARQFASAQAKFRAALGIAPRHGAALIGIADAYRAQGLTRQAVQAYRRYLEVHPSGPRAAMARHYIEELGGEDAPAPALRPEPGRRAPSESADDGDGPRPDWIAPDSVERGGGSDETGSRRSSEPGPHEPTPTWARPDDDGPAPSWADPGQPR
jgi:predicted Zn finger-like uncharacterized protein